MKTVLILDDNPQINTRYFLPLESRYKVEITMRMVSAERMARHSQYDFIVIDVMMPTQKLDSYDEMSAGYVFYRDVLQKALQETGYNPKIIFWSRREVGSFNKFWPIKPINVFFLQKSRSDKHLKEFLMNLE